MEEIRVEQKNYKKINALSKVFILGAPHSGSTFIHSLLDNHPQIFSVPFLLRIHERRWNPYLYHMPKNKIDNFVRKLFSKKACSETNHPGCLLLSTSSYHDRLIKLLESRPFNRREFFLCIYQAYAEEAKIDLNSKRLLLENAHTTFCVDEILDDFPDARFIQPVRDPRALYNSFVARTKRTKAGSEYWNLKLLLQAFANIKYYKFRINSHDYFILKNEDLMPPLNETMEKLAEWIGVDFDENMLYSTFGGRSWKGNTAYKDMEKVTPKILSTRWQQDLSSNSKLMIEYYFYDVLKEYGYDLKEIQNTNMIKKYIRGLFSIFSSFQPQMNHKAETMMQKTTKYCNIIKAPIYRIYLKLLYDNISWFQNISKKIAFIKPGSVSQLIDLGDLIIPQFDKILMFRRKMKSKKYFNEY